MSVSGGRSPNPVISVLLPVYNAERYLSLAIESVLAQSFRDFELLALDDGSTDQSLQTLKNFESWDSRVCVLSRENRGLIATLNELITLSKGEFLARMDADDICRPQRFARQLAYLQTHSECVAVGTRVLVIDPEGLPICAFSCDVGHDLIDSGHIQGIQSRMCHPSIMMRRAAVVKAGLYSEEFPHAEDLDLLLRLGELGKLANLSEVLLEYRHHLNSICYRHPDQQRSSARKAVMIARHRRGLTNHPALAEAECKTESNESIYRKWAWWALAEGHQKTARKYAFKAAARSPFDSESLKLLACAIRGR